MEECLVQRQRHANKFTTHKTNGPPWKIECKKGLNSTCQGPRAESNWTWPKHESMKMSIRWEDCLSGSRASPEVGVHEWESQCREQPNTRVSPIKFKVCVLRKRHCSSMRKADGSCDGKRMSFADETLFSRETKNSRRVAGDHSSDICPCDARQVIGLPVNILMMIGMSLVLVQRFGYQVWKTLADVEENNQYFVDMQPILIHYVMHKEYLLFVPQKGISVANVLSQQQLAGFSITRYIAKQSVQDATGCLTH